MHAFFLGGTFQYLQRFFNRRLEFLDIEQRHGYWWAPAVSTGDYQSSSVSVKSKTKKNTRTLWCGQIKSPLEYRLFWVVFKSFQSTILRQPLACETSTPPSQTHSPTRLRGSRHPSWSPSCAAKRCKCLGWRSATSLMVVDIKSFSFRCRIIPRGWFCFFGILRSSLLVLEWCTKHPKGKIQNNDESWHPLHLKTNSWYHGHWQTHDGWIEQKH